MKGSKQAALKPSLRDQESRSIITSYRSAVMSMARGILLGSRLLLVHTAEYASRPPGFSKQSCTRLCRSSSLHLHFAPRQPRGLSSIICKLVFLKLDPGYSNTWVALCQQFFCSLHSRTIMLLKDDESTLLVFKFVWGIFFQQANNLDPFAVVLRALGLHFSISWDQRWSMYFLPVYWIKYQRVASS